MAFFPLPTSPPICLLLLPSGTRVRRSDLPQMVSCAPASCSALATLETHPLSFYPLAWFTFFSPVSSPRYSSFSFFPPRDLSLPSLLASLHSLLLHLRHVAQWLYHVLSSLTSPVTMCLYVGLSALFLYVHFPLDAFGYVFNVFLVEVHNNKDTESVRSSGTGANLSKRNVSTLFGMCCTDISSKSCHSDSQRRIHVTRLKYSPRRWECSFEILDGGKIFNEYRFKWDQDLNLNLYRKANPCPSGGWWMEPKLMNNNILMMFFQKISKIF